MKHHADAPDQDALQPQRVRHVGRQHGVADLGQAHAGQPGAPDLLAVGDQPLVFVVVSGGSEVQKVVVGVVSYVGCGFWGKGSIARRRRQRARPSAPLLRTFRRKKTRQQRAPVRSSLALSSPDHAQRRLA